MRTRLEMPGNRAVFQGVVEALNGGCSNVRFQGLNTHTIRIIFQSLQLSENGKKPDPVYR
jgi:hypothetical protein